MVFSLPVTPEQEALVRANAARQGQSPESFLLSALDDLLEEMEAVAVINERRNGSFRPFEEFAAEQGL